MEPLHQASPLSIWLITVGEPLPFSGNGARLWRTGILAKVLTARGHNVLWWTSTVDHFEKRLIANESERRAVSPRLAVQFLHGRLYSRNVSLARLLNHRQIAAEFRRIAATLKPPDVIVCSYPTIELCDEAVGYGCAHDVPVLLDVRDLWPDEMAARMPSFMRGAAPWLLWPLYRSARRALAGATGIVAISETYLSWARRLGRRARCAHDLFAPMGYDEATLQSKPSEDAVKRLLALGVDPGRKFVWFCGTFVGSIDLLTAIHAARILRDDPSISFVFTGSGERDAEWRAAAIELSNVVFTGWADRAELAWLASHAWVGLAAYKERAMMSLPNKLFEYMAAGLPILCSLDGEAAQMLAAHAVGQTYTAGDPVDLAAKIRALQNDLAGRNRLAANARAVFERHFKAEAVYGAYAAHLESCTRGASQGSAALPARA